MRDGRKKGYWSESPGFDSGRGNRLFSCSKLPGRNWGPSKLPFNG